MKTEIDERRAALFARTTTETLLDSALLLDGRDPKNLTQEDRLALAWTLDEIERRTPALDAVLDAWAEGNDGRTYTQVVAAHFAPFKVGDKVRVTSHYSWCGKDTHGDEGTVETITFYPLSMIDGGAIYSVRRAWGAPVPLTAADIERVS